MIMDMKEFTLDYVTYKVDDKNTPIIREDSKYLIDITDPEFKDKMNKLSEITLEYNKNGKTCEEIALEYRNYPELIYLLPTLKKDFFKEEQKTPKSIKELFELNKTIPKDPKFVYSEDINSYLDYIYNTVYDELLFQRYKFVANGSGQIHSQLWFMPTTMKGTTKKEQKQIKNPTVEKEDNTIIAPMLSNLAKMIVEHDKFKKFNVCVIHSIKSGIVKGGYISQKDTEDPTIDEEKRRRVYYECIGNKIDKHEKSDVKKCILKIENKSRQNGKSLIILTAQRLRLGISLPCVDVAIHMDDIKSYDIIYQSMFRVLTERAGKQRGYFVDMVLDRAIQFFYKYTKVQKHIKMNEEGHMTTKDIVMSLSQFDAGGINSSIYDSTDIVVNSYQEIAEAFKIDTEENFKQYEEELLKNKDDDDIYDKQQMEKQPPFKIVKPPPPLEDIKRQTTKLYNFLKTLYSNPRIKPKLLEKIKNLENTKYSDDEPNNPNTEPGKTDPQNPDPFKEDVIAQPKLPPNQVNKEDKDTSDNELLNNISKQIKNIFTLIILFGGDDITLEEAINTEQINYQDIKRLCESDDAELTEEVDKVMYYCYLIQNHIRQPKPGDIVSKINNEGGNVETGVILKIVKQHICRDISKCFKDGQRIRFTHDRNLIATYNKNENKLVYNGDKYDSLNKLMKKFYEMVDVYSGWNAWSHFEFENSPDNWLPIMEIEINPPEIKVIPHTSEYARFLDDIDNNENKCKPKEPKPKEPKPKKPKEPKEPKEPKPKKPRQSRKKSNISQDVSIIPEKEVTKNLAKTKKNKVISQITPSQILEEEEKMDMNGGATGTPNEEKTTYYILWNPDKSEPERCIEIYDEARLQENVIMPKLTADEIQEIIEKYIGQNGIINFLIEKEKESGNKGEKSELNNLFTYIKGEMKEIGQRIEKEKEGFDDETKEDSDICSEFFKTAGNEKVLETIRRYLTPKDTERKLFGEVFTPLELVCEMLSKLPSDVWTKKDYKWLDPANGIGNFPVVVYYKLMKTLKSVPEKNRSKWIIEKMLYMNELNKVNVGVCRRIFKMIDPTAEPNIIRGDFLKKKEFKGVSKFDIIIGNPPYNKGGIKSKTTTNIDHSEDHSETIWPKFVETSLGMLKTEHSYLLFIHPGSWIGIKAAPGKMITSKQILYLRFYNYKQANLLFGNKSGKIPLTYYVLQNIDTKNDITIYDNATYKNAQFNIYEANFVPTESVSMMKKIFEFTKQYGNLKAKYGSCKNATETSNKKDGSHTYPIISIANKQIEVLFSKINNNNNDNKKLLLANSSMGYPILDNQGDMFPESSHQFVLYSNNNENELKQLQNYFYTILLFYLINITKTSQNFFDNKIFEIVPDITKITKRENITDEFLIDLFKLTKTDLIGYENYKTNGEGRLPPETIEEFKHFNLSTYKPKQPDKIKEPKELNKPRRTRGKKGGFKQNKKRTRKNKKLY
jgi:hypothetical protein